LLYRKVLIGLGVVRKTHILLQKAEDVHLN